MKIEALIRYPIKGMAGEACRAWALRPGHGAPGDRRHALMRADRPIEDLTSWAPKRHFMQGMYTTTLSMVRIDWTEDRVRFETASAHYQTARNAIDQGLADWLAGIDPALAGLRVLTRPAGWRDVPNPYLSLLNPATVRAIADQTGTTNQMARYRGNLWVRSVPAFAEYDWIGRTLQMGGVELRVVEPIVRCKATELPGNGERDRGFLDRLETVSPDLHCGVYVEVVSGGEIALGDPVWLLES